MVVVPSSGRSQLVVSPTAEGRLLPQKASSAFGVAADKAPYCFISAAIAAERLQSGFSTPAGHGISIGAAYSFVSSGFTFLPAGANRSEMRVRSGRARWMRL